jgi:hypothetical protein
VKTAFLRLSISTLREVAWFFDHFPLKSSCGISDSSIGADLLRGFFCKNSANPKIEPDHRHNISLQNGEIVFTWILRTSGDMLPNEERLRLLLPYGCWEF